MTDSGEAAPGRWGSAKPHPGGPIRPLVDSSTTWASASSKSAGEGTTDDPLNARGCPAGRRAGDAGRVEVGAADGVGSGEATAPIGRAGTSPANIPALDRAGRARPWAGAEVAGGLWLAGGVLVESAWGCGASAAPTGRLGTDSGRAESGPTGWEPEEAAARFPTAESAEPLIADTEPDPAASDDPTPFPEPASTDAARAEGLLWA
jgi:hypothetical protein